MDGDAVVGDNSVDGVNGEGTNAAGLDASSFASSKNSVQRARGTETDAVSDFAIETEVESSQGTASGGETDDDSEIIGPTDLDILTGVHPESDLSSAAGDKL